MPETVILNTKRILLITTDKGIAEAVRISALTLTKLNCQVTVDEVATHLNTQSITGSSDLNLIILDMDADPEGSLVFIKTIRSAEESSRKKILAIHGSEVNNEEIFSAGCDSIMKKDEFRRVINNILSL